MEEAVAEQDSTAVTEMGEQPVHIAQAEEAVTGAPETEAVEPPTAAKKPRGTPLDTYYGKDGFTLDSEYFRMSISGRLQFRYSYPQDGDGFSDDPRSSFRVRRARLKVGGFGYREWLNYFFEYDLPSNTLNDWRVTVEKLGWLKLRVGQWKVDYNRERVDSSGRQQFVDRSIVNSPFTLDRQIGAMLFGDLFKNTPGWLVYHAGVFTGVGLNQSANDDRNMLYVARLQWNFLGNAVPFRQGDPEITEKPAASLAFAAATNRSNRKRFPQTDDLGEPGQFEIHQAVEEIAFKWKGLSLQQEYHLKQIRDTRTGSVELLSGLYAQAGYLPGQLIGFVPDPLEIAFRYAFVNPRHGRPDDRLQEYTVGANWFFAGHSNKLTADVSWLTDERTGREATRFRLQWDVTF